MTAVAVGERWSLYGPDLDYTMTGQTWCAEGYDKNARFVSDLGMPVVELLNAKSAPAVLCAPVTRLIWTVMPIDKHRPD